MNDERISRAWAELCRRWRPLLLFHLLMQLLGFAFFAPLLTWVARRLVRA